MRSDAGGVSGRQTNAKSDPLELLRRLEGLPTSPLGPEEVPARRRFLEEVGGLLLRLGRSPGVLPAEGFLRYLDDVVASETARAESVAALPWDEAEAFAALEELWFARNPGRPPARGPALVLTVLADGGGPAGVHAGVQGDRVLEFAVRRFVVREGVLEGCGDGAHRWRYRLLNAPLWVAASFPAFLDGEPLGAGPRPIAAVCDVSDLGADPLESMLALWVPDVASDLFDLCELRIAVVNLERLDSCETIRLQVSGPATA